MAVKACKRKNERVIEPFGGYYELSSGTYVGLFFYIKRPSNSAPAPMRMPPEARKRKREPSILECLASESRVHSLHDASESCDCVRTWSDGQTNDMLSCNPLQRTASRCDTLQRTASCCLTEHCTASCVLCATPRAPSLANKRMTCHSTTHCNSL